MDLQLRDPRILKCSMLQLLLRYPNGVNFGNFIGAFYQVHRYHPQFSRYGYSSLRHFLDDMKEAVVVEGNSCNPVMKLANGFNLNGWMDENEKYGLDSFEKEDPVLKDEGGGAGGGRNEEETAAAIALAEVLAAVTSLLKKHEWGLQIKKIQKFLLATHGINLEMFSVSKGYKDILTFLENQIPNLNIKYPEKARRCVVQLSEDLTVASVPICGILQIYPNGLKVKKLKEAVKKKCGYDLEVFCSQLGYEDVVSCLQKIPELIINKSKKTDCVVRLQSGSFTPASSLDGDFFDNSASTLSKKLVMKKTDLTAALVPVLDVLSGYPCGMNLSTLKENLEKKHGFDLEAFSQKAGCNDVITCLMALPGLHLSFWNGQQPHECIIMLLSSGHAVPHLPHSSEIFLDQHHSSNGSNLSQELVETKPTSFSCSSSQFNHSLSFESEHSACTSKNSNQDESEKKPAALRGVMASLTALLTQYKSGLRVKKVQEFLLAVEGIDLEKFSIAQGHKDAVEFLEQQMPKLKLKYRQDRINSVVELKSGKKKKKRPCTVNPVNIHAPIPLLESTGTADPLNSAPGLEDISKPALAISDPSASDSQHQRLPAPIAVVHPEVNKLFHTNKPVPSATTPNVSSFQEPNNALSVKTKRTSLSPFSVLPDQPNTYQFVAESLAEEIPSNSHLTTFQPSVVLDELKQQVAHILAMHPEGMSLFQFRAAYSATFEKHFPVGNAASAKQRLLEMPDIVYLKGHGVQVLLLPVSSDISPVKSGQTASSKVENVAVVSSLALVKPLPLTKSSLKTLQSHSIWTPPLESLGKPGGMDSCTPKDLSLRAPSAPWQEQEKVRTSFTDFSDQLHLSKIQERPVIPGHSLPKSEPPVVPQSYPKPAVPKAVMMPVPKPRRSLLKSSESVGAPENKGNKPCTELHPQDVPSSVNTVQKNMTNLKLTKIPLTPHSSAALPIHSQDAVCDENLQPDILKSRPASLANSWMSDNTVPSPSSFVTWQEPVDCSPTPLYPGNSVLSVDPAPVPPVSVNLSGIHLPKKTSQSSCCAQSMLPVQPLSPILSTEQRNCNHTLSELDPFSQVQKQSTALQHSLSSVPDSSTKRHSVSSLARNSASFFPSRSQPDHQVQQHTHARLDDLQPISVSLADKSPIKTSLGTVSSAATYQNKSAYVNPLETTSTRESFSTCSINEPLQSLHALSAVTNNSRALSSISSLRTKAVSPASSPLESTSNSSNQFAYASAKITSDSSSLSSETHAFTQQRQYARATATGVSNRKASSATSSLPDSTTSSSHQFAYDSTRITTHSSALSSEAYAFAHQRQNTQASAPVTASSTKTASSISSPLDSTTHLSAQYACASAKTTSSSNVLSSEAYAFTHQRQYSSATASAVSSRTRSRSRTPSPLKYTSYHLSSTAFNTSLTHAPPSQNNFISSLSEQGDSSSASLQEKQMPYYSVPQNSPSKSYDKCFIL